MEWIKLIAASLALVVVIVLTVMGILECRSRGGVLVNYSCVKTI